MSVSYNESTFLSPMGSREDILTPSFAAIKLQDTMMREQAENDLPAIGKHNL